MKKPTWIENAYKSTDVHWAKSQAKIMDMLSDVGINEVRFTSLKDRFVLEFMAQWDERSVPRGVRIVTPLHTVQADDPIKRNKELNIVHRILLNHLKAKFVAIGNGLTEFEQEFMSHLVITDKAGKNTTLGEAMLPEYKRSIEDGDKAQFKLGDGN